MDIVETIYGTDVASDWFDSARLAAALAKEAAADAVEQAPWGAGACAAQGLRKSYEESCAWWA